MITHSQSPLVIDGAEGEGGGQILRTSLTLAVVTGRSVRIENIRAGRKKPGLMRQHLTAVRAAARISGGRLAGDVLGSKFIEFEPQGAMPGHYELSVGTAGSTTLVFQTVFPALIGADGDSVLSFSGGTHNPMAPCFEFLAEAYMPLLRQMGCVVELHLARRGFAPAGGGSFVAKVSGVGDRVPLACVERGKPIERRAVALVNELPASIGERELKVVQRRLELKPSECVLDDAPNGQGPGNVVLVSLRFEHVTEVFVAYGQPSVSAERIAHIACDQAERYLGTDAPVGDYLADQLLLPMALGAGGTFRTVACSPHFNTNKSIIEKFLDVRIRTQRESRLAWRIEVET